MERGLAGLLIVAGCGASAPPQNQLGPPGTWTCKQIVESCDSMCQTGMCLNACSNQGSQQGGSLHASLIQCAAANRCFDDQCTRAVCGPQVDACLADGGEIAAAPPPPIQPVRQDPPVPHEEPQVTEAPAPRPVEPPAAAIDPNAITGDWAYGAKSAITAQKKSGTGNGGILHLSSDGRFERATNVEANAGKCKTETFTYAIGAWKLDGATLVLSIKEAATSFRDACKKANNYKREAEGRDERRAVRMPSDKELAITDDAGELQSYRKR